MTYIDKLASIIKNGLLSNSLIEHAEAIVSSLQDTESKTVKKSLDTPNLVTEELANSSQSENQMDSPPQYKDLFYVVLPSTEKALSVAQTMDQVAEGFNQVAKGYKLSKKVVADWLKAAAALGRIKKIPDHPVKSIAASSRLDEQLECNFVT
jgi:hypothetical protein